MNDAKIENVYREVMKMSICLKTLDGQLGEMAIKNLKFAIAAAYLLGQGDALSELIAKRLKKANYQEVERSELGRK